MPQVEVLIGMIASGKSTYTSRRAKEGAIIVNDDTIVTSVHGGDYTLYDIALKPLYKSVESNIIIQALTMGRDVIIDRPNYRLSTRRRYIGLAQMLDCPCIGVIFDRKSPEVHATRRFNGDARGHSLEYWTRVAKVHADLWQNVSVFEDFTSLTTVAWRE